MTVEQYGELPETEAFYHELHNGKLARKSWPKIWQIRIRGRLRDQLNTSLVRHGVVFADSQRLKVDSVFVDE